MFNMLDKCEVGDSLQFQCKSGECIPMTRFCDFRTDCKDGSDENNCS